MDEDIELGQKPDPKGDTLKRELQRKSLDTIRVYNPTNKDYVVDWDGFKHKIPAKSERSIQRYLAEKYVREMKNLLINEMADKELETIKSRLGERGMDDVIYNANLQAQRGGKFRTDNPELIKDIYSKIWLGVEEKYGADEVNEDQSRVNVDTRSEEEKILSGLNKKYVSQDEVEEKVESKFPINKKKSLVDEVSA